MMKFAVQRRVVRCLAVVALLCGIAPRPASQESASAPVGTESADAPLAAVRPEVRLRKLHLVRPDLIPYPIASEIYC